MADALPGQPDWFELYNPGSAPVDLAGYYLTDDKGADVCFDPIGGKLFDSALSALGWGGRTVFELPVRTHRARLSPEPRLVDRRGAPPQARWRRREGMGQKEASS